MKPVFAKKAARPDPELLTLKAELLEAQGARVLPAENGAVAVERFAEEGVSQAELDRVRELAKANVLMGLESTTARMNHMARSALRQEPVRNEEEIIAAYDSVTAEQIRELAQETFQWDQCSFSAVGKVDAEEAYRSVLG